MRTFSKFSHTDLRWQKVLNSFTLISIIMILPLVLSSHPVFAEDLSKDHACLSQCHGQMDHQVELNGASASYVDVAALRSSVHRQIACLGCHGDITKVPHDESVNPVRCVGCHYKGNPRQAPGGGEYRDYVESVHAEVSQDGKKKPKCIDCHGIHNTLSPRDKQSQIYRMRVPETCGQCHTDIYREYMLTIHGKALLWESVLDSPNCVDCHGVHRILAPKDERSPVHPTHVSQTCSNCHEAVEVVGKYGISTERVTSYKDSYHGLANKYGVHTVANCATCHGVHNILPSTDAASSIHPDNLHLTCGQQNCHPQAVQAFARGSVHLGVVRTPNIIRWIRIGYTTLIILTIGGMVLYNIFDFISVRRRGDNVKLLRRFW